MKVKPAMRTAGDAPLERRVSYRCSMIAARITRLLAPMWRERHGLNVVNWRVLAVIGRYAPVSAKDVAAHTSSEPFHVSRALEALTRRRLVVREVDGEDRRRVRLRLSPEGRAVHRSIETSVNRLEQSVLEGMSAAELADMDRILALLDRRVAELAHRHRSSSKNASRAKT
jgi:DNA-binding MarR family transcriptional regulator